MTGWTKNNTKRQESHMPLFGAIGALVYRFVTPGWVQGPGDPGGPGT
jgi:hypothetical protein